MPKNLKPTKETAETATVGAKETATVGAAVAAAAGGGVVGDADAAPTANSTFSQTPSTSMFDWIIRSSL